MSSISYSAIMTRLVDLNLTSGYVTDTSTSHIAWRFYTGRTDFGDYFREDVEGIIVNQLDQLGVPITQQVTIPQPAELVRIRVPNFRCYCFTQDGDGTRSTGSGCCSTTR